jgi:hypothetical protein
MLANGSIVFAGILCLSLCLTGCQKKQEEPKPADTLQPAQTNADTAKKSATPVETAAKKTVSLIGSWKGELDSRTTTLKITEQKRNSFSGTIVINWREVVNQKVSGTVNPDTREVQMKDMLHARNAAKYSGKLSKDGKTFSGTYTQIVDNQKSTFSLSLK